MRNYLFILLIFMFLSSCRKKETPVPKHELGNVITSSVNLCSDYRYQIYFNLKSNSIVGQNLKTDWDLGFETTEDGYRIILNSANAMYAYNTGITDFNSNIDTNNFYLNKKFDSPTGNLDSTAIGNWKENNPIYIIDRGFSFTGTHLGYKKIQILSSDNTKYNFKYSNLDGTNENSFEIIKDSIYNFTFFSFNTNSTKIIEPPKTNWDIVFTQFIESLSSPYLVTGCLLNRYKTYATVDTINNFNNIDYNFSISQILSQNINSIGYQWKEYNYSTAIYEIFPNFIYILKDQNGLFFKLHFIDFYNESGDKGSPKWEYQQL